jgi:hypothetical protein
MQTQGMKWFDPRRMRNLALAIGIVGSLAIGAATVAITRDDVTDTSADTVTTAPNAVNIVGDADGLLNPGRAVSSLSPAASGVPRTKEQRLDDLSVNLGTDDTLHRSFVPGAGEGIVGGNRRDVVVPAVISADEMRFIEQNVNLPGPTTRAVKPDYRLRDLNVLPGDDVQLVPPHADPTVQH